MRDAWTDERLDDLVTHLDRDFDGIRVELRELRRELGEESRTIRGEMAAMQRSIVGMQRTTIVGFVAVIASVLATQL